MASNYLPKPELVFYASVYVAVFLFSAFQLLSVHKDIYNDTDPDGYLPGWSFLGRPQDRQDYEWSMWTSLVRRSAGLLVVHLIVSELTRTWSKNASKYWYLVCGMVFVVHSYGWNTLILVLFKVTTFLGVYTLGRKWLVWLYFSAWLVFTRIQGVDEFLSYIVPDEDFEHQHFELWILICWNQLKILSACLDMMDATKTSRVDTILDVYSYVFYLPNMVPGPVFLFERYIRMMDVRHTAKLSGIWDRSRKLLSDLVLVVFAYFFIEAMLHVAYLSSLSTNLTLVNKLSAMQLYSFGYLLAIQFFVKYSAMYGLSHGLARFEGMETLSGPRYIGIVNWFSDMWKLFDTNLYEFLFKYIYTVLCQKTSPTLIKFASSAATFVFIYVWHGTYDFILYWTCLNYLVVVVESVSRSACRAYQPFFDQHLSAANKARLAAILGSQLFIVGALSNFLFFTGTEVGEVFFRRTYSTGSLTAYVGLSATTVCMFHTAEWYQRGWGNKDKTRKKLK